MTDLTSLLASGIALAFFAAGIVKGVTGMGLPTIAMGVLGALLSPLTAAGLLVVPSLVTNVWQLLAGSSLAALARRLRWMMLAIVAGTLAGTAFLAGGSPRVSTMGLGAALAGYAVWSLLARPLTVPAAAEPWLSPVIGLATGLISGSTGVFVIPAVPYLQAMGLARDDLVQALGLSFTVSTVALAAGLAWHGAYPAELLALSFLAVLPALLGMVVGQRLRGAIGQATFRRWFLLALLLLGAEMMLRSWR